MPFMIQNDLHLDLYIQVQSKAVKFVVAFTQEFLPHIFSNTND